MAMLVHQRSLVSLHIIVTRADGTVEELEIQDSVQLAVALRPAGDPSKSAEGADTSSKES